jgi:hypothetical protein
MASGVEVVAGPEQREVRLGLGELREPDGVLYTYDGV